MAKKLLSLFTTKIVFLSLIGISYLETPTIAQESVQPPPLLIFDRQIEVPVGDSYVVYDICRYGPGFC